MAKIAIIGSGIMGISQALALSQHFQENIQIVVFDARINGGEASFSGQSRAHGGGSSMLFDTSEIINRKYVGQTYLNVLGALDKAEEAVYGFESNAKYSEFMAKAAVAGVPFKPFEPDQMLQKAFSSTTNRFTLTFEHPINFARTRFGMLKFLGNFRDRFRFIEGKISTIKVLDNGLLKLSNDQEEFGDFNIVINSAGRFTNEINVLGREQQKLQKKTNNSTKTKEVLEIKQATWPFCLFLLCH